MQFERLYRGQPNNFRNEYFTPSALRLSCIKYMEEELSKCQINVQKYKQKCIPNRILQQYCNSDYQPPQDAFYAYWLSLVNCSININRNIICYNFCKSPFFTKNINKDKIGVYGLPNAHIADECYSYAKDFFDSDKQNETYHLQLILHDYAFFQHLNHVFAKTNKNKPSFFPTLVLDWTWDKNIAERFAGETGNILSISWEAYKAWTPFKNHKVIHIDTNEQRTPVFGFESYLNNHPWNEYDWYSIDNNLMIEQKGVVLFWPWNYTIDQLLTNTLGRNFAFSLEK
jgi:hypothetical protein